MQLKTILSVVNGLKLAKPEFIRGCTYGEYRVLPTDVFQPKVEEDGLPHKKALECLEED